MFLEETHTLRWEPSADLLERLQKIYAALDDGLGDSDLLFHETDEEMRRHAPVQWAAKELAQLVTRDEWEPDNASWKLQNE